MKCVHSPNKQGETSSHSEEAVKQTLTPLPLRCNQTTNSMKNAASSCPCMYHELMSPAYTTSSCPCMYNELMSLAYTTSSCPCMYNELMSPKTTQDISTINRVSQKVIGKNQGFYAVEVVNTKQGSRICHKPDKFYSRASKRNERGEGDNNHRYNVKHQCKCSSCELSLYF